jgi:prepilin-type N-terminal cleavage/methylation domain-containing protein/prepilin-type processing-associated H-X9-DG protein
MKKLRGNLFSGGGCWIKAWHGGWFKDWPSCHMQLGARKQWLGFTLVEMLVVCGVLGILAGLVLPVLVKARHYAHLVKCTANLRQFGIATHLYWEDNRGECFKYVHGQTNYGVIYWFGWIAPGVEGERDFDRTKGALYPYLLGTGVEICPGLNYAMAQFKLKARGAAYGYGYNLCLSRAPKAPPFLASNIRRPSQTALFADAAQVNTFQWPASIENPMLEEFYYISTNTSEATVHFRHNDRAGVVFSDGHAERQLPQPGSVDSRLPGQVVGRLNSALLVP